MFGKEELSWLKKSKNNYLTQNNKEWENCYLFIDAGEFVYSAGLPWHRCVMTDFIFTPKDFSSQWIKTNREETISKLCNKLNLSKLQKYLDKKEYIDIAISRWDKYYTLDSWSRESWSQYRIDKEFNIFIYNSPSREKDGRKIKNKSSEYLEVLEKLSNYSLL